MNDVLVSRSDTGATARTLSPAVAPRLATLINDDLRSRIRSLPSTNKLHLINIYSGTLMASEKFDEAKGKYITVLNNSAQGSTNFINAAIGLGEVYLAQGLNSEAMAVFSALKNGGNFKAGNAEYRIEGDFRKGLAESEIDDISSKITLCYNRAILSSGSASSEQIKTGFKELRAIIASPADSYSRLTAISLLAKLSLQFPNIAKGGNGLSLADAGSIHLLILGSNVAIGSKEDTVVSALRELLANNSTVVNEYLKEESIMALAAVFLDHKETMPLAKAIGSKTFVQGEGAVDDSALQAQAIKRLESAIAGAAEKDKAKLKGLKSIAENIDLAKIKISTPLNRLFLAFTLADTAMAENNSGLARQIYDSVLQVVSPVLTLPAERYANLPIKVLELKARAGIERIELNETSNASELGYSKQKLEDILAQYKQTSSRDTYFETQLRLDIAAAALKIVALNPQAAAPAEKQYIINTLKEVMRSTSHDLLAYTAASGLVDAYMTFDMKAELASLTKTMSIDPRMKDLAQWKTFQAKGIESVGTSDFEKAVEYFDKAKKLNEVDPTSNIYCARAKFLTDKYSSEGYMPDYFRALEKIAEPSKDQYCEIKEGRIVKTDKPSLPAEIVSLKGEKLLLRLLEAAFGGEKIDSNGKQSLLSRLSESREGRALILIALEAASKNYYSNVNTSITATDIHGNSETLKGKKAAIACLLKAQQLFMSWGTDCAHDYLFEAQMHYDLGSFYLADGNLAAAHREYLEIKGRNIAPSWWIEQQLSLFGPEFSKVTGGSNGISSLYQYYSDRGQITVINDDRGNTTADTVVYLNNSRTKGLRLRFGSGIDTEGNGDSGAVKAGYLLDNGTTKKEFGVYYEHPAQANIAGVYGAISQRLNRNFTASLEGSSGWNFTNNDIEWMAKAALEYSQRIGKNFTLYAKLAAGVDGRNTLGTKSSGGGGGGGDDGRIKETSWGAATSNEQGFVSYSTKDQYTNTVRDMKLEKMRMQNNLGNLVDLYILTTSTLTTERQVKVPIDITSGATFDLYLRNVSYNEYTDGPIFYDPNRITEMPAGVEPFDKDRKTLIDLSIDPLRSQVTYEQAYTTEQSGNLQTIKINARTFNKDTKTWSDYSEVYRVEITNDNGSIKIEIVTQENGGTKRVVVRDDPGEAIRQAAAKSALSFSAQLDLSLQRSDRLGYFEAGASAGYNLNIKTSEASLFETLTLSRYFPLSFLGAFGRNAWLGGGAGPGWTQNLSNSTTTRTGPTAIWHVTASKAVTPGETVSVVGGITGGLTGPTGVGIAPFAGLNVRPVDNFSVFAGGGLNGLGITLSPNNFPAFTYMPTNGSFSMLGWVYNGNVFSFHPALFGVQAGTRSAYTLLKLDAAVKEREFNISRASAAANLIDRAIAYSMAETSIEKVKEQRNSGWGPLEAIPGPNAILGLLDTLDIFDTIGIFGTQRAQERKDQNAAHIEMASVSGKITEEKIQALASGKVNDETRDEIREVLTLQQFGAVTAETLSDSFKGRSDIITMLRKEDYLVKGTLHPKFYGASLAEFTKEMSKLTPEDAEKLYYELRAARPAVGAILPLTKELKAFVEAHESKFKYNERANALTMSGTMTAEEKEALLKCFASLSKGVVLHSQFETLGEHSREIRLALIEAKIIDSKGKILNFDRSTFDALAITYKVPDTKKLSDSTGKGASELLTNSYNNTKKVTCTPAEKEAVLAMLSNAHSQNRSVAVIEDMFTRSQPKPYMVGNDIDITHDNAKAIAAEVQNRLIGNSVSQVLHLAKAKTSNTATRKAIFESAKSLPNEACASVYYHINNMPPTGIDINTPVKIEMYEGSKTKKMMAKRYAEIALNKESVEDYDAYEKEAIKEFKRLSHSKLTAVVIDKLIEEIKDSPFKSLAILMMLAGDDDKTAGMIAAKAKEISANIPKGKKADLVSALYDFYKLRAPVDRPLFAKHRYDMHIEYRDPHTSKTMHKKIETNRYLSLLLNDIIGSEIGKAQETQQAPAIVPRPETNATTAASARRTGYLPDEIMFPTQRSRTEREQRYYGWFESSAIKRFENSSTETDPVKMRANIKSLLGIVANRKDNDTQTSYDLFHILLSSASSSTYASIVLNEISNNPISKAKFAAVSAETVNDMAYSTIVKTNKKTISIMPDTAAEERRRLQEMSFRKFLDKLQGTENA